MTSVKCYCLCLILDFWYFGKGWNSWELFYLYHDVDILLVLQQTEVGKNVRLGVLGVGVSHGHLALPQGLKQDFLPLSPLFRQQLPLEGQCNWGKTFGQCSRVSNHNLCQLKLAEITPDH